MIERRFLQAIAGKSLFYPSAGNDWPEAIELFSPYVATFWFVDINYCFNSDTEALLMGDPKYRILEKEITGNPHSRMEIRKDLVGNSYRFLEPCILREQYENSITGNHFAINRRRGFGQCTIEYLDPDQLGVFFHRGDSQGEGGSNAFYLGNRRSRYEPIGCLFDKLRGKLVDGALIVTDGSNCDIRQLKVFHNSDMDGHVGAHEAKKFTKFGYDWECVGNLANRYGPTLIWLVKEIN